LFHYHSLDICEQQGHPNDIAYPGAPPTAPYDIAGWTLAYQMGVQFDRVLDGFDGPLTEVKGPLLPPPGRIYREENVTGFFLDPRLNDSFRAVNRLLAAGQEIRRLQEPFTVAGMTQPAGAFFIRLQPSTIPLFT